MRRITFLRRQPQGIRINLYGIGAFVTTDYKRHRVTGDITFSLSKAFRTDLRELREILLC